MPEGRAVTLRRLVVRAGNRSDAETAAASFAAGFAPPLDQQPAWDAGPRSALSLAGPIGGAQAGAAAASALRGRLGERHG
ncbi:MAG: hypothetical protein ACO1OD_06440 [Croceibacterium sp.]